MPEQPPIVIVERRVVAVGGEEGCIEHTALIKTRPAQGNRSMEGEDPSIRQRIRELTFELVGRREPLPRPSTGS